LFDKRNLKYYVIWPISITLAIILKFFGYTHDDVLSINNYLVPLLVFGPALLVTIVLVLNKILNS